MAVKTTSFEVVRPKEKRSRGEHDSAVARIREACELSKEVTNHVWEAWRVWHVQNGSRRKILDYLDKMKAWHESKDAKGKTEEEKPKCEILAFPNDMVTEKEIIEVFPTVHVRAVTLLLKRIKEGIKSRKSANGSLSGWMSILLYREGQPSFCRPIAAPFDKRSAEFLSPLESGGNHRFSIRLDRFMESAKKGGVKSSSTKDEFELLTKGKRARGQRAILDKVLSGEYAFKGSQIVWSDRKRKVFVMLCYEMPDNEAVELGNKTAILRPANGHPWRMRYVKISRRRGGSGRSVSAVRQKLLTQRWSRQENYRHAGSSNRGHGRKRALKWVSSFSRRWKDFVQTCNHRLTSQIVEECLTKGIGRLVYIQPGDRIRGRMFMAVAGKVGDRTDSTSWDWHQVKTQLSYKCKEAGIHFECRKGGEAKKRPIDKPLEK